MVYTDTCKFIECCVDMRIFQKLKSLKETHNIKAYGAKPVTANGSVAGCLLSSDRGTVYHTYLYTQIQMLRTCNMKQAM
jgi:hypothetical protein